MNGTGFGFEGGATDDPERRWLPRYAPVKDVVYLGWWVGSEFRTTSAVLKDIGLGGASLLVDAPDPVDRRVWISLEGPNPGDWVEARVIDVETIPGPDVGSPSSALLHIQYAKD